MKLGLLAMVVWSLGLAAVQAAQFRFMTYNTLEIGAQGTTQYNALKSIVSRICADAVVLQEITDTPDIANFEQLATDAGFAFHDHSDLSGTLSGNLRTGCMTNYAVSSYTSWSAAEISGDAQANDLCRDILSSQLSLPSGQTLCTITVHLKSGSTTTSR